MKSIFARFCLWLYRSIFYAAIADLNARVAGLEEDVNDVEDGLMNLNEAFRTHVDGPLKQPIFDIDTDLAQEIRQAKKAVDNAIANAEAWYAQNRADWDLRENQALRDDLPPHIDSGAVVVDVRDGYGTVVGTAVAGIKDSEAKSQDCFTPDSTPEPEDDIKIDVLGLGVIKVQTP